ncbi:MAG: peptide ABC transporter substrate-binding protein [Solobacterium sp.]|jgi:oligopeptide transport system substrate-binding protein|nr:peptide ABC transporter substrate-binding protein [Solobacterium sp.]MCH4221755.1 peptide ABC transporter substrate-binding protein [Solobacterium sp.]MCH4266248.1 peptide ABC transporter substrate-binding protein [Solobacterium sp.]
MKLKTAGIFMLALSMLTGCSGGSSAASGSGTTATVAASGEKDATQELNLRSKSFGNDFDVQDMGWRWMMAACDEGLLRDVGDASGDEYILAGAESIDVSDDNLTYTFHLRQNAKWSDGVAVTAADYEYGWKRLINPDNGYDYASFLFGVEGAEAYYNGTGSIDDVKINATDDYTFVVTLSVADPTFESKLVATPLYPTRQDVVEKAGDSFTSDWKTQVFNGPYYMSDLVEDSTMTWTKNPYYWDADEVSLEKVNWYAVSEDQTAATMFDNGQLDVLDASGNYISKYDQEASAGQITSMTTQYPGTAFLCYEFTNGGTSGLMQNVNIRKAISYCLNREEMCTSIYGRYTPAYGLVSPAIMFNDSTYRSVAAEPIKDEYDQYNGSADEIQKLFQQGLDELGITENISDITITFLSYGSTTENQSEREYIKQVIEKYIGCKVNLNTAGDYTLFKSERDKYNYDIMFSAWYSDYNDPLDFLNIMRSGIYSGYGLYASADYDSLLDSLTGVTDMTQRLDIYEKLENKLLVEDCAIAPVYYADKHYYIQNWVKDFHTSSFGASSEVYNTYISGRQ